jgi:hypothetical protein
MKTKANEQNPSRMGQGRQKQPANEPHVRSSDAPSHGGGKPHRGEPPGTHKQQHKR